jgi:hypothetical protein
VVISTPVNLACELNSIPGEVTIQRVPAGNGPERLGRIGSSNGRPTVLERSRRMSTYEIIADPEEYGIEALVAGLGAQPITFPADERVKWAKEVEVFTEKLTGLTDKARELKTILESGAPIKATPASLKTLKVQLFTINDALEQSMAIAERLETEIVPR